jgi:hypothetical protein
LITPETLQLGDTWGWTAIVEDYPATEWTLKFAFRGFGLSVIDITASADGDDYEVTVAGGVTAGYLKGSYQWTAYVEKGTTPNIERYTVGSGTVTLLPYLAAADETTDNRSHAQKMLDGIEATLEGRASHAELSLTVNGKAIQYMKPEELIRWRSVYRREVSKEIGNDSTVRIQFGSA